MLPLKGLIFLAMMQRVGIEVAPTRPRPTDPTTSDKIFDISLDLHVCNSPSLQMQPNTRSTVPDEEKSLWPEEERSPGWPDMGTVIDFCRSSHPARHRSYKFSSS